ncbi:MAG: 2-amino-4-hydroxy-6-hydroxymethyldihydropteridine diphosphokinase [Desulfovibrio sp.]|nr:2-amino-4-hydroxy-6-hydroxymethyldihydropteridine diphosphokinase [Desulfovibrio sp.]
MISASVGESKVFVESTFLIKYQATWKKVAWYFLCFALKKEGIFLKERAFVSLGANLGNVQENLHNALGQMRLLQGVHFGACSSFYWTEPQEDHDQPWFLNAVVELLCEQYTPQRLLSSLLNIESRLGRVRERRYGPRVIDLDLLLYGDWVVKDFDCTVPHPKLFERAFVLIPLLELAPNLVVRGVSVQEALAKLPYRCEGERIYQSP